MKKRLWIGTSGYNYSHWRSGVFYPPKLPQSKWLEYYASIFNSVEINATFYKLATRDAVKGWYKQTPPDFRFVVKGSRFITHMKRLTDPVPALRNFFRPLKPLNDKLSLVLWQFPENLIANTGRLQAFTKAFRKFSDAPLAFEFRNPTWFVDQVTEIIQKERAAFCRADRPEFYESLTIPDTAPFVYFRRHGPLRYAGGYSEESLQSDAKQIRAFRRKGREVYIYFNNDIGGHAPRDAKRLESIIKGSS